MNSSNPTLLKYVKTCKNRSHMFKLERFNPEDDNKIFISRYNDSDWVFIAPHKLKPRDIVLKSQRLYELQVKERKWNNLTVKTFHLYQTLETLDKSNEKNECIIQQDNEKITKYFKVKCK